MQKWKYLNSTICVYIANAHDMSGKHGSGNAWVQSFQCSNDVEINNRLIKGADYLKRVYLIVSETFRAYEYIKSTSVYEGAQSIKLHNLL